MKNFLILTLLLIIISCQKNESTLISIQGKASIEVEPNVAYLTISVSHLSKSTKSAMENVSNKIDRLIQKAHSLDIKDKHIQTTRLKLNKNHKWVRNTQVFMGYNATSNITFEIEQVAKAETIVGTFIEIPDIEISNFRFHHTSYDSLQNETTLLALQNAKEMAEKVCDQEKLALGKIHSFSNHQRVENHVSQGVVKAKMSSSDIGSSSNFTLKSGVITIQTSVFADYLAN